METVPEVAGIEHTITCTNYTVILYFNYFFCYQRDNYLAPLAAHYF